MLEAIVLVGGRGTRLRPLTETIPKPLLPVAGVPFLHHQFARLRDAGVTRVVLATAYRAELFHEEFGDGGGLGLDLRYVTEDEPLGTGGAIAHAAVALDGAPDAPVVVLNGDILSGHDIAAQVRLHVDRDADVTLHLVRVADPRRFGCVPTDGDGRVTAFLEKMPDPVTDQINAGCYVFRRGVIDAIPNDRPVSVERETFPDLLAADARVVGYVETAYWLDLGTPESYVRGSADLVPGVVRTSAVPGPPGPALLLDGATVADSASAAGGSVIGRRSSVGAGASVRESVLLDDVVVGPRSEIDACIVGRRAVIGDGARLRDCVVGDGGRVPAGAVLTGALVGVGEVAGAASTP
jgi:mannose-1-phosphate guanylyltransferase